jgi:hypothetical protein
VAVMGQKPTGIGETPVAVMGRDESDACDCAGQGCIRHLWL